MRNQRPEVLEYQIPPYSWEEMREFRMTWHWGQNHLRVGEEAGVGKQGDDQDPGQKSRNPREGSK